MLLAAWNSLLYRYVLFGGTMKDIEGAVPDSGLVVLKFFASWCGPCKMLSPRLDDVATKLENEAMFLQVNADKHAALMTKFGVKSLPTVVFIKDGVDVYRIVGLQRVSTYEDAIAKYK
jgi:thioredoxin 1